MYVCVCYAIKEAQIRDLIGAGQIRSVADLNVVCSAGSDCGCCMEKLKNLIEKEIRQKDLTVNKIAKATA